MILVFLGILVGTLSFTIIPTFAETVTIDFDSVDTNNGSVSGAAVESYFAGFGITITDDGSVQNDFTITNNTYDNRVFPVSSPNFFERSFGNEAYSYTLSFETPLDKFEFTRAQYSTISGPIWISPWDAQAFDSNGSSLGVVGEGTLNGSVAATSFSFNGPDIAKVTVYRNSVNTWTGMAQVPFDNFILTSSTISVDNTPPTITFSLPDNYEVTAAPGTNSVNIIYSAWAVDDDGSDVVSLLLKSGLLPGTDFPVGTTVNTFEAVDVAGNVATASFSITVLDSTPIDTDGDGINNDVDTCVNELETVNGYLDNDGCPDTVPDTPPGSILINFDSVNTKNGSVSGAAVESYLAGFGITITDDGSVQNDFTITNNHN